MKKLSFEVLKISTIRKILSFLFIIGIVSLVQAVINEETARSYFSKALLEMYNRNFNGAYELSKKALSGRVFVNELPYFWYLRGKLAIINGAPDKAIEDFKMFTQLVKNDDIDNLIGKIDYFRKINLSPSKKFELKYISTVSGIISGIEYFHTPTSLTVYGDSFAVLDSKNKRIIYFKSNRISKIKKVSKEIKEIIFGLDGKLYLLGEKSLFDDNELELISGLKTPYAAGPDRDGNIIIVDFDRVLSYNVFSKRTVEKKLTNVTTAIDVEITNDKIYILDGLRQTLDVYSKKDITKIQSIKLTEKTWAFEVTPYGDIIYVTKNKIKAGNQEFEISGADLIEYSYPTLFVIKWKARTIDTYVLKDDKPIFVNIDRIEFDDNYGYAYVRIEDLFGDVVHYVQHSLSIAEHDVYVPSTISLTSMPVDVLELKNCSGELITYRLQGVWVMGNCPILTKFTGSPFIINDRDNPSRLVWQVRWNYIKPVPPGIVKLTAKVNFKDSYFFDTSFYSQQLIKLVQKK